MGPAMRPGAPQCAQRTKLCVRAQACWRAADHPTSLCLFHRDSGRKRASLLYVLTYAASCATKHSPNYNVLLAGRLLGGVSTSLLFSVFEAWAVAAHMGRGFDESLLVSRGTARAPLLSAD